MNRLLAPALAALLLWCVTSFLAMAEEIDSFVGAAIGPLASQRLAALQGSVSRSYNLRTGESPVDSKKRLDGEVAAFFSEMLGLGEQISEETLKQMDPRAKTTLSFALIDMAHGVVKQPALAEEILAYYGSLTNRRDGEPADSIFTSEVSFPRPLTAEHAEERYRFAWRIWLVAPYSDRVRNVHRSLPDDLLVAADRASVIPLLRIAYINHEAQRAAKPSTRPVPILMQFSKLEVPEALAGMASFYAIFTTPAEAQAHRPGFVNLLRARIAERGETEAEQFRRLQTTAPADFAPLVSEALMPIGNP